MIPSGYYKLEYPVTTVQEPPLAFIPIPTIINYHDVYLQIELYFYSLRTISILIGEASCFVLFLQATNNALDSMPNPLNAATYNYCMFMEQQAIISRNTLAQSIQSVARIFTLFQQLNTDFFNISSAFSDDDWKNHSIFQMHFFIFNIAMFMKKNHEYLESCMTMSQELSAKIHLKIQDKLPRVYLV